MSCFSPQKKSTTLQQQPKQTPVTNSINATPNRTTAFTNVKEIPLDAQSQYTISYLNGISEHAIETGNTLEEAKMKVVLLTCELEKINSYNYTLVKENEVLRVQTDKSKRERDLETKLAIVLAENEKLNQVIEELYQVYMSRSEQNHDEYENRIAELYQNLDEWRQKYDVLQSQTNVVELQNDIKELQDQKDLLTEQLNRKDRDLETLRARIAGLESNKSTPREDSNQKVLILTSENNSLKKELEAMKLKYGKADSLQLKLAEYDNKIRTILGENEKLNDMLNAKVEEVKRLKEDLEREARNNQKVSEVTINLSNRVNEEKKKSANANQDSNNRLLSALKENEDLQDQISRLNALLAEKERELQARAGQSKDNKPTIEQLSLKIRELIKENDNLTTMMQEKSKENTALYVKLRDLEGKSIQNEGANLTMSFLLGEKDKLKDVIAEKDIEIEGLYARLSALQSQDISVEQYTEKIILITQENERLNNLLQARIEEIDGLKRRLSEFDSASLKIESYESKISILYAENIRLSSIITDLTKEADSYRLKLYEANSKPGQLEELQMKLAMISSENERLNNELDSLRAKARDNSKVQELQARIDFLITEKVRLETLLDEKKRENNNLRDSQVRVVETAAMELSRQNETLKSAGLDQKRKIGELEGRLAELVSLEAKVNYYSMEVERLHKDVLDREDTIRALNQKLDEKERELSEAQRKALLLESQRQYDAENLKNSLVYEQERKLAALRDELEGKIWRLTAEKKDLEDMKLQLEALVQDLKSELDEWKRRYFELESSRANDSKEIEEVKRQFELFMQKGLEIKDMQQKFGAEREAYETQILQLNLFIQDLQRQVEMLGAENERLTNLNVQRLSLIEELKLNNDEDAHKLEVYELKSQVGQLKSSSYDIQQLTLQYSADRAADQTKIKELTDMNANYKAEIEKLRILLDQRKADAETLTQQCEALRKMCEKLKKNSQESLRASGSLESTERLRDKINELELSRNEYQRQAERNAIELTRKNKDLVDKIQELDVLKLKYEEGLANYQALNSQLFQRLSVNNSY